MPRTKRHRKWYINNCNAILLVNCSSRCRGSVSHYFCLSFSNNTWVSSECVGDQMVFMVLNLVQLLGWYPPLSPFWCYLHCQSSSVMARRHYENECTLGHIYSWSKHKQEKKQHDCSQLYTTEDVWLVQNPKIVNVCLISKLDLVVLSLRRNTYLPNQVR